MDTLHKRGVRICPRSSKDFSGIVRSFQRWSLGNQDPAFQMETLPVLAPEMDKMIKKKMENHKSNYRDELKARLGESFGRVARVVGLRCD